jgi:hypothetical protein
LNEGALIADLVAVVGGREDCDQLAVCLYLRTVSVAAITARSRPVLTS